MALCYVFDCCHWGCHVHADYYPLLNLEGQMTPDRRWAGQGNPQSVVVHLE